MFTLSMLAATLFFVLGVVAASNLSRISNFLVWSIVTHAGAKILPGGRYVN